MVLDQNDEDEDDEDNGDDEDAVWVVNAKGIENMNLLGSCRA